MQGLCKGVNCIYVYDHILIRRFFSSLFQLLVEEESVLVRSILHLKVGHGAEQVPI